MLNPLSAFTPVYRVVEVLWTSETMDGRPRLVTGRVEYRWTRDGAEKLCKKRTREAHGQWVQGYVIQGGVVRWVPDDEWEAVVRDTPWHEDQNVDERITS